MREGFDASLRRLYCFHKRMFGICFDSTSIGEQLTLATARCCHDSRQRRRAARECSRLIEDHHVQIAGASLPLTSSPF